MSSYYLLEISCSPGGARKGDYYVFNNLTDIKDALIRDLADIYMLIWYGQKIILYIIDKGKLVIMLNLLPWITVQIEGLYNFKFNINELITEQLFEAEEDEEEKANQDEIFDEFFCKYLTDINYGNEIISNDLSEIRINHTTGTTFKYLPTFIECNITVKIDYPYIHQVTDPIPVGENVVIPEGWIDKYDYEFHYGQNNTE